MSQTQFNLPCYTKQLEEKTKTVSRLFDAFSLPKIAVFASDPIHYRLRAEFRIWHDGEDLYPIMFDQNTKKSYRVHAFFPGSRLINQALTMLMPKLKLNALLRFKLFQIDFLSTLSGELLISLVYHKKLEEDWILAAKTLKNELGNDGLKCDLIGRASKQKILLDRDFVQEQLTVDGKTYDYQQVENSFTQPNGKINEQMLTWAVQNTKNSQGDLLELYCGNGNFSIALAANFNRVLATEISKTSVQSAQQNIAQNQVKNLTIVRLSAEEFAQAMNGERTFLRLQDVDLTQYDCQTVLVDPPRAGLDQATLKMIAHYPKIIYISCNPNTLKDNLNELIKTHDIEKMALFDQFPYTHHVEIGLILTQKTAVQTNIHTKGDARA